MMLIVSVITFLVLYFSERKMALAVEEKLHRDFDSKLAALHNVRELRQAALLERCRALVRKARIHAALEDGALDLLYPSARDELRDVMTPAGPAEDADSTYALHAVFYRFLDRDGIAIPTGDNADAGRLPLGLENRLGLAYAPDRPQFGYVADPGDGAPGTLFEVLTMPVISHETNEVIAALVLGFELDSRPADATRRDIRRGIWLGGQLFMEELSDEERMAMEKILSGIGDQREGSRRHRVGGTSYQVFYRELNPGSLYPPAYEVCVYSLAASMAEQRQLRHWILGAGVVVLLGSMGLSHFFSGRLAVPVQELAVDSAENRLQRELVEAALESTNEELQRAARFSADASHQLKTPVAVLRAGLEEVLAGKGLSRNMHDEIAALIRQTYRLSEVIDGLLLLSRLDAGRLQLKFGPVNLSHLVAIALDDQDTRTAPVVETDVPDNLFIAGEEHYTSLILQNLLDNACKYNRPGGRIRLVIRCEDNVAWLAVGNTGSGIPASIQAHIFERFHRGAVGENVPGYGLGLNLARELARLHGGDLRLKVSGDDWTEFEVCFRVASPVRGKGAPS